MVFIVNMSKTDYSLTTVSFGAKGSEFVCMPYFAVSNILLQSCSADAFI